MGERGGRAFSVIALAALLAAATLSPVAPPRSLPCLPPIDRPLRLTMEQRLWRADGRPGTVRAVRALRFRSTDLGVLLEARLIALDPDPADPAAAARLRATYGPVDGAPMRIRLDATMAVVALDDMQGHWGAFLERQAVLRRALDTDGVARQRADRMAGMLAAMDEAGQLALLTGFLAPVLRHCGAPLPLDARVEANGAITVPVATDSPAARDMSLFMIDADTGLLRSLERSLTPVSDPLRPLTETWALTADY